MNHVEAEAKRLNLPVRMSIAMMVVESDGKPTATSPAGARGLMQVTPITMKELAKCDPAKFGKFVNAKGEAVNMHLLADPKTGVEAGMAALKMYMDRYNGDPEKALIAYNWGPGNVGKTEKDCKPKELAGYNRAQTYVADIQTVLGSTRGSQSGKPEKATLPKTSLLHYLPAKEADRYLPKKDSQTQ